MRKFLILGLLVVGCSEESSCFDTLTCPPVDTTTGGTAGSGGENSGGTAGTGNSGGGGSGGTTSTTGVSGSSVGGSGGAGGTTGGTSAMGGTGGGGMGGSSGAPAGCDGACGGDTPVCDEAADTCVQCLVSAEHCEAPTPACDPESHECVECVETADCDAGVCDAEAQHCVDCLGSEDCEAPTPLCDTEAQLCVECLGNADCTSPLEAYCDAGSCSPCQSNADCAHLTGTTVCDTAAGECVECTGTDYESCGLNDDDEQLVCDSLSRTCTDQVEHGVGLCDPCVSDANCALGELCAMHTFQSQELGYFCFWKEGDTENGAPLACGDVGSRPYAKQLPNTTSIDQQVGTICGLDVSTCTARNQFRSKECGTTAGDDSLCGVSPPDDAVCRMYNASFRCTMTCRSDDDCPPGGPCIINVGVPYCEL